MNFLPPAADPLLNSSPSVMDFYRTKPPTLIHPLDDDANFFLFHLIPELIRIAAGPKSFHYHPLPPFNTSAYDRNVMLQHAHGINGHAATLFERLNRPGAAERSFNALVSSYFPARLFHLHTFFTRALRAVQCRRIFQSS